jgi:hypothetical protein
MREASLTPIRYRDGFASPSGFIDVPALEAAYHIGPD